MSKKEEAKGTEAPKAAKAEEAAPYVISVFNLVCIVKWDK
jgi:hypothetical protein